MALSSVMTLQSTYTAFPAIAYAGMLMASAPSEKITLKNASASTSMPFGSPVKFKASPATDKDADVLSANTDVPAGLILHSHAYARVWTDASGNQFGELDGTGLVVGVMLNVLRRGIIALACVSTTAVGNKLHVSFSAGATFTAVGMCGGTGEATHTVAVSGTQFLTSCAANGFAWCDVDFIGATVTAD